MQMNEGKQWGETQGRDSLGSPLLHCAYQASDGLVFGGAQESNLSALANVPGLSGIGHLSPEALTPSLEERFVGNTVATWVDRLASAGVGAQKVVTEVRELVTDPWVVSHGLSIARDHDEIGPVTTCGPPPRLSRT